MFAIKLSNGTSLSASINLRDRCVTVTQEFAPGVNAAAAAREAVPSALPQRIVIPLADVKHTAQTVADLVKVFRG